MRYGNTMSRGINWGFDSPNVCNSNSIKLYNMREMYCLGDYVSQIGKRVCKCKQKPDTGRIYNIQKYLGVNIRKCLINNVRMTDIIHLDILPEYVSIVSDCTLEHMQDICERFNKIGEVSAVCFNVAGRITVKFVAVKFLQISLILAEKHGVDLNNKVIIIKP